MLVDDPVHYRHAETGSFSHLLGGKEGLKDPVFDLFIHADAGIGYRYQGVTPRFTITVGLNE